jgi:hypothetical protein
MASRPRTSRGGTAVLALGQTPKLQFLVFTSPQEGRNGVYSEKGSRSVMLQGEDVYAGQSTLSPYPVDRL